MLSECSISLDFKVSFLENIQEILTNNEFVSAVGHADTAQILTNMLEIPVSFNRISLNPNWDKDWLVVAQYSGPRLPEGTTCLPENGRIIFYIVTPDIPEMD
jgi:hypothetical protein